MNEYKGISMFKVSKEQHRRLLVSLRVVVVLTVIRNIVLPGLPGNAENAGLLLLLPVVKGKVFMFILGAAVVVAQCVILNELRVALRRIAHWGQWACLVFMVALVSNFMLGSVFTWFGTDFPAFRSMACGGMCVGFQFLGAHKRLRLGAVGVAYDCKRRYSCTYKIAW